MDPPPRSLARRSVSLLHGLGPFGSNRLQACGASSCAHRQAPLGSSVELYPIVIACRRAHVRQGQGPFRAALKKRAVLDARCARRLWHLAGGRKKACGAVEQKKGAKKAKKEKEKVVCGPPYKKSPIQAVCLNRARTDLRRGRWVTCVPTAISNVERFSPAPGHHGYARAFDLTSGDVSLDTSGHQVSNAP